MPSAISSFKTSPVKTDVFEVRIVPYELGWFKLIVTVDDRSVWADNDITGIESGHALLALEIIGDWMGQGDALGFIPFNDESLDTAALEIKEQPDGMAQVYLYDWCDPDLPPRLHVLADAKKIVQQFQSAVAKFREIDHVEPYEFETGGYRTTVESIFEPTQMFVRNKQGALVEVKPEFTPPWRREKRVSDHG